MFESKKQTLKKQLEGAKKFAVSSSSKFSDKGKTNYREFAYRLCLLNKAEEVANEAVKATSRKDAWAYTLCARFYKDATNTDGPGPHDISFRDSIREKNKQFPDEEKTLISAFKGITAETMADEDFYEKKITNLIEKVCDYVLFHREKYVPTK